jgi:DNA-binding MarR family transcriptional regulator
VPVATADADLARLAGSIDRMVAWTRRSAPPGGHSLTARSTLARLDAEGPGRISDLARVEGVTQPAMTGLVNRLEAEGKVRRAGDPADARATLVSLTPEGQEFVRARRAERARVVAAALERLDAADRAALLAAGPALDRLAATVPAAAGPH